jgi:rubredoxin
MSEPLNSLEPTIARPFPWRCPRCGRKEVRRATIPSHCQRLKNGRPLTVIISDLSVPKCGHCGELVFDYVAEEQINRACEAQASQLNNAQDGEKNIAGPMEEQGHSSAVND